jgi:hypothetical protein
VVQAPEDLAAFFVKAAATVVRFNLTLGPDEASFRRLAIDDLVDGIPLSDPWGGLHARLLAGEDPAGALSQAFAEQAIGYCEAAARATVELVEQAVGHLRAAGGDEAVQAFLDDLQRQEGAPAA